MIREGEIFYIMETRNREIKAVASRISHELKTPLNAIIGFSELIDEERSVKEIKNYAKIIKSNGSLLLNQIQSIIDFCILDYYSEICLEEVDLNNLVFSICEEFESKINFRTSVRMIVDIQEDNKAIFYSDKNKIKEVLTNLISNAVKFTKEGRIEVGYKTLKEEKSEKILIYVSDTGIGIPTDIQKVIFKPFRQAEESNCTNFDGLGIGLAICDKLSKILNGRIWVESKLGEGTTFFFELPVNEMFLAQNSQVVKNH